MKESKGHGEPQFGEMAWSLFLVFLLLKLAGKIVWPWWLVLSPLWGGLALAVLMGVVAAIAASER